MLAFLGLWGAPAGPRHSQITPLSGPPKVTVSWGNGSSQDLGRASEMPASLHAVRKAEPQGVVWGRGASTPQAHRTGGSGNWSPLGCLCQCSPGKAPNPPGMTVPHSENGCANSHDQRGWNHWSTDREYNTLELIFFLKKQSYPVNTSQLKQKDTLRLKINGKL